MRKLIFLFFFTFSCSSFSAEWSGPFSVTYYNHNNVACDVESLTQEAYTYNPEYAKPPYHIEALANAATPPDGYGGRTYCVQGEDNSGRLVVINVGHIIATVLKAKSLFIHRQNVAVKTPTQIPTLTNRIQRHARR